jgi:hypothetical protein
MRWYFRKLIGTAGSLFHGIDSSGGINSAMELIPLRKKGGIYTR